MAVDAGLLGSRRLLARPLSVCLVSRSCPGPTCRTARTKKQRGPSLLLPVALFGRQGRVEEDGTSPRLSCSTVGRPHRTTGRWARERHGHHPPGALRLRWVTEGERGAGTLASRSRPWQAGPSLPVPCHGSGRRGPRCFLSTSLFSLEPGPTHCDCRQPSNQGCLYPVRKGDGAALAARDAATRTTCWTEARRVEADGRAGRQAGRQAGGQSDRQRKPQSRQA